MAFSVIRSLGSKIYNGLPNSLDVLITTSIQGCANKLPILSSCNSSVPQFTSIRCRTKAPKRPKTGQFPPDLFKVSNKARTNRFGNIQIQIMSTGITLLGYCSLPNKNYGS